MRPSSGLASEPSSGSNPMIDSLVLSERRPSTFEDVQVLNGRFIKYHHNTFMVGSLSTPVQGCFKEATYLTRKNLSVLCYHKAAV